MKKIQKCSNNIVSLSTTSALHEVKEDIALCHSSSNTPPHYGTTNQPMTRTSQHLTSGLTPRREIDLTSYNRAYAPGKGWDLTAALCNVRYFLFLNSIPYNEDRVYNLVGLIESTLLYLYTTTWNMEGCLSHSLMITQIPGHCRQCFCCGVGLLRSPAHHPHSGLHSM